jgi:uncharacterized protein YdiU (UPF0061 family)
MQTFDHETSELTWNSPFTALGPAFFTRLNPTPLPDVHWVSLNHSFANEIGLNSRFLSAPETLQALSGCSVFRNCAPYASVYSGHQFGHWAGQLGDGRAIALGELSTSLGPLELQLKGAGPTPYSRMGDGRAVLRSSIREYLCSEAMHALSIPTTRALCLSGSPAPVARERVETAAVLTRVSPCFIRFGHFEHFASRSDLQSLKALADFVIERYAQQLIYANEAAFYPNEAFAQALSGNPYAHLLFQVTLKTAELIAHWQSVGFCHGVMNTDNMSILGLTLDYGPFQFLDAYDEEHICNHTDHSGRYAFNQQPSVAYWNLYCLGQSLMGLIQDKDLCVQCLDSFQSAYPYFYNEKMMCKLGLPNAVTPDICSQLIKDATTLLSTEQADYTLFWRALSRSLAQSGLDKVTSLNSLEFKEVIALFESSGGSALCSAFLEKYRQLIAHIEYSPKEMGEAMLRINPKYVLRNHLGELAIRDAEKGDFAQVDLLLKILQSPFEEHEAHSELASKPPIWAKSISISCSS